MTQDTWLDADTEDETPEENAVRGGYLSMAGRKAAIGAAVPLVGRYFQRRGSRTRLRNVAALAMDEQIRTLDERLLAGLRLRAALATSDRLVPKLEEVVRRPTFRYALTQADSMGELRGTLDLGRYVSRPPSGGDPPTYPVLDVRRSSETPENVMCAYAALWMMGEIEQALNESDATAKAPETGAVEDFEERFGALLVTPALSEGRGAAGAVLMRGTEEQLLDRVEERLRRGEVGNPQPYEDLLTEMRDLRHRGPTGGAGGGLWSFYDDSFDARLFELWCLHRLAEAVSDALAVDMPAVDADWSGGGLTFRWTRPVGMLELQYQRSLTTVADVAGPLWTRVNDGQVLQGIPDIIAKATTHTGVERVALLDSKLRQRSGPPTEELYKMLGYFNNFCLDEAPRGAIFYHAPHEHEPHAYLYNDASTAGVLVATALNPSDEEQVAQGMRPVADMVVGLLGLPPYPDVRDRPGVSAADEVVRHRLAELEAIAVTLSPQTLDASKKRLRAALGDPCWLRMSEEAQRMIATAENVGFFLQDDADFSGPVLGLLSPLEALLQDALIEPARAAHPMAAGLKGNVTFGNALGMIQHALNGFGKSGSVSEALREVLDTYPTSYAAFQPAIEAMVHLNKDYRTHAAHKETLSEQQWLDVYGMVIHGRALLCEAVSLLCVGS